MFGPGGISIWQLLIILVIVVLLFGTKKLRGMGGDLGTAIKGFKKSVKDESAEGEGDASEALADGSQEALKEGEVEAEAKKENA